MSPSCVAAARAPRTALAARVDGASEESWLAQERAAAEKVGGDVFYPAALRATAALRAAIVSLLSSAESFSKDAWICGNRSKVVLRTTGASM